jgi:DNA-binding NarL/FixJ family response regulator
MDDSPIVRLGIHAIADPAHGLEVVGAMHDGVVSPEEAQRLAPDVIVVNSLSLPKERLDRLPHPFDRAAQPSPRILMIVGEGTSPALRRARASINGTVPIQATPDEFLAAINLVAAGYSVAAPEAAPVGADRPLAGDLRWKTIKLLTQREVDVLRAVAQGSTNAEIARLMLVSESTVKSHVQNLLAKLGLPNRAAAVALAYEAGMLNGDRPEPDT